MKNNFPNFHSVYIKFHAFVNDEKTMRTLLAILTCIYYINPNTWNSSHRPSLFDTIIPLLLIFSAIIIVLPSLLFNSSIFIPVLFILGTIKSIYFRQHTEMAIYMVSIILIIIIFTFIRVMKNKLGNRKQNYIEESQKDWQKDREPSRKTDFYYKN